MLNTNYYIKIFPSKIVAKNLSTGVTIDVTPDTPYLHQRFLIGNINSAEFAIAKAFNSVKSFSLSRRILIHPICQLPGGPSEAEERLFRMAAYDACQGQVFIWFGSELTDIGAIEKMQYQDKRT
jgi:hypothetical protein